MKPNLSLLFRNSEFSNSKKKIDFLWQYNTKYYYEVGIGYSPRTFWFVTPPEVGPDVPYTFGLIGELIFHATVVCMFFLEAGLVFSSTRILAYLSDSSRVVGIFFNSHAGLVVVTCTFNILTLNVICRGSWSEF